MWGFTGWGGLWEGEEVQFSPVQGCDVGRVEEEEDACCVQGLLFLGCVRWFMGISGAEETLAGDEVALY